MSALHAFLIKHPAVVYWLGFARMRDPSAPHGFPERVNTIWTDLGGELWRNCWGTLEEVCQRYHKNTTPHVHVSVAALLSPKNQYTVVHLSHRYNEIIFEE